MNVNIVLSLVRAAMQIIGAAGFGILSQTQSDAIITALPLVLNAGATLWGAFIHTKAATVKAAADIVPIAPSVQVAVGVKEPITVPTKTPEKASFIVSDHGSR